MEVKPKEREKKNARFVGLTPRLTSVFVGFLFFQRVFASASEAF